MVFKTAKDAIRNPTYAGQVLVNIIINWGINFGFAWAASNDWGKNGNMYDLWNSYQMTQKNNNALPIPIDLALSVVFMGFFATILGTKGIQKEVEKGKCEPVDPRVLGTGLLRFTPVRIPGLCFRGLCTGLYFWALAALPTTLIFWAALGTSGGVAGLTYTVLKSIWCAAVSVGITSCTYFSALDARNFPDMEGVDQLIAEYNGFDANGVVGAGGQAHHLLGVQVGGPAEPPPLVGNVARA